MPSQSVSTSYLGKYLSGFITEQMFYDVEYLFLQKKRDIESSVLLASSPSLLPIPNLHVRAEWETESWHRANNVQQWLKHCYQHCFKNGIEGNGIFQWEGTHNNHVVQLSILWSQIWNTETYGLLWRKLTHPSKTQYNMNRVSRDEEFLKRLRENLIEEHAEM